MDAADYVNPDYSLKNKANRKVRDLSIVRTAGHKNMVMVILQRISYANSRCSWRTTRTDHDKICL